MSAGFTPGPWKVFYTKDGRTILGVGDERTAGGITDCGDVSTNDLGVWRSGKEKEANARLIAAAPELYEALDTIIREFGHLMVSALSDDPEYPELRDARAALAKARGETTHA